MKWKVSGISGLAPIRVLTSINAKTAAHASIHLLTLIPVGHAQAGLSRYWSGEIIGMATITVTTLTDENDPGAMPGLPGGSGLSLREAIAFADGNPGADTIVFDPFLTGGTITLTNGQLSISDTLIIDGDIDDDKSPDITVNANNASRVITTGVNLTLQGLTITGGRMAGGGGGILATGIVDLTIEDSRITGNATTADFTQGGGIFINAGNLTITNSIIDNNSTNGTFGSGGGIYSDNANVTLIDSTVSGNSTAGNGGSGGGISSDSGSITLTNSTVSGNSTAGSGARGGGIHSSTASITLTSSTVSGNGTTGVVSSGGGIATDSGDVTLTNSTVAGNSAAGGNSSGGGIYSSSANIYLTNTTITGNSASFLGGAIEVISGYATVSVINSLVLGNSASGNTEISAPWSGANSIVDGTPADIFAAIDGVTGGGLLADNGGPVQTVALKNDPLNPALDAGDDSLDPATDARGRGRFDFADVANNGANISDLGAFELRLPEARSLVVTTLDDVVDQLDGETSFARGHRFRQRSNGRHTLGRRRRWHFRRVRHDHLRSGACCGRHDHAGRHATVHHRTLDYRQWHRSRHRHRRRWPEPRHQDQRRHGAPGSDHHRRSCPGRRRRHTRGRPFKPEYRVQRHHRQQDNGRLPWRRHSQ
jgi:hypothetical protein